jgi:hypothetical protein
VLSMDTQQQEEAARADATRVMPLPPYALRAGPREQIYFDPKTVTAAIISTGTAAPASTRLDCRGGMYGCKRIDVCVDLARTHAAAAAVTSSNIRALHKGTCLLSRWVIIMLPIKP